MPLKIKTIQQDIFFAYRTNPVFNGYCTVYIRVRIKFKYCYNGMEIQGKWHLWKFFKCLKLFSKLFSVTEAAKEKKLREKSESLVRQLEKDLAALKVGGLTSGGSPDGSADVVRLKAELERLEVSTQETLIAQQAKFNVEVSAVRDQFEEAERRCRTAEMDMAGLREKLEKARLDSLQVIYNCKQKYFGAFLFI